MVLLRRRSILCTGGLRPCPSYSSVSDWLFLPLHGQHGTEREVNDEKGEEEMRREGIFYESQEEINSVHLTDEASDRRM